MKKIDIVNDLIEIGMKNLCIDTAIEGEHHYNGYVIPDIMQNQRGTKLGLIPHGIVPLSVLSVLIFLVLVMHVHH